MEQSYKTKYTHFDKFLNSLHTEATKQTYKKQLYTFLKFLNFEDCSDLITKLEDEEKHDIISDYLNFLRNSKNLSGSQIKSAYSAIRKFYTINRVKLDWEYLAQFKGKSKGKKIDDRLYTNEEIEKLLLHADLREKVIIHCLLSTGMRVGGLAEIKIKDMDYIQEYKLYKFRVYADSIDSNDKYVTFCTPECAKIIKQYLQYRELRGDTIKPNSPLIYRKHATFNAKSKKTKYTDFFHLPIDREGIGQIVTRLQRRSMVAKKQIKTPNNNGRIRKEMMRCHAFRKQFDTVCIKNNINHSIKERLMGHKYGQGLDFNYMRLNEIELLQEYLKIINDLTVSEENKLRLENEQLKHDYDVELKELVSEMRDLKQKMGWE